MYNFSKRTMNNTDVERKAGISVGLSHILDGLGCSPQMINLRRRLYRDFDYIRNHCSYQCNGALELRSVGSKGEGLSRLFESDFDLLLIHKYVVCIEASELRFTESPLKHISVYTMIACLYHPGHFKLLLTREGLPSSVTEELRTCLNPSDSGHWLSSKEFLKMFKSKFDFVNTTAGPALCITNRPDEGDQDTTITLPCICPSILGNWIQRNREFNWPPSEVIQQISQMNGNLVATGIKDCHDEEIEWRLCFNEIEILLAKNWNETATKLYVCLKIIKKNFFKLQHDITEITSYIMKNIVLWLSERYPQTDFRHINLFSWVIKALRLLKRAVKGFRLPYYMIPERNLIAEKLPKYKIKDVIKRINNAIKLGPQLLWNCKKIEMAMTMSLPELQLYKEKTDEMEWLLLIGKQDHFQKCEYLGLTERDHEKTDNFIAISTRMAELMYSPWPPVVQQLLRKGSTRMDKLKLLLQ